MTSNKKIKKNQEERKERSKRWIWWDWESLCQTRVVTARASAAAAKRG